ncbi:MAG TPA: tetratricopeptide repeat protein [Pyrinomonadaceae bacterium]
METEVLTTEENAFDELDFDESVELRALVRSLKRARNFALLFARCNQRPQQRELIEQIKNELPDKNIEIVYFENEISHFLDELKVRLEGKTPDAVFVYGLENSLGNSATADKTRFVLSLNVSRNNFPQVINCPIVFWLPDYGIKAFANGAPDFFSVRSGVYFFNTKENLTENQIKILTSGDYYESATLAFNEREERISHIQNLLLDYKSIPKNEYDTSIENQLKLKLVQLFFISAQYDKAIEISKSLLAKAKETNDLNLEAEMLNDLATLYQSQNKYEKAKPLYKKALQIRKQILGEDHPETANTYNNLAVLLFSQRKYKEAEPLLKKALQIREEVLGKNHPDTATSYNNLASFNEESQRKYKEAESLFRKALQIREKVLGKNHPETAASYNNLAGLYLLQGKSKEAESLFKKALQICEKVLGKEHPTTNKMRRNLANIKEDMKTLK